MATETRRQKRLMRDLTGTRHPVENCGLHTHPQGPHWHYVAGHHVARRRLELTFWNRWVAPRRERTADGTTTLYFGIGRLVIR